MIERDYYGNDERQKDLEAIRERAALMQKQKQKKKQDDLSHEMDYRTKETSDRKSQEDESQMAKSAYRAAQLGRKYAYAEEAEKMARSMASRTKGKKDDERAASVEEMLEASVFDNSSTLESMWDEAESYVGEDDGPDF